MPFAFGDVIKDSADLATARFADARSVSLIPTPGRLVVIFNTLGFSCLYHIVIDFKPVAFSVRGNLASQLAHHVFESRLLLEDLIHFQKTVINRLWGFVINYLENAEAFVNRIEQRSVFFFRFA
nr:MULTISPECIES: hypothetical protein [unclassified Nostoc]MDZ7988713.1 hypothetical protein [Nostoc sp. DedVER02]MDZ8113218.1 hypothetical protein [Nostoc sp. DedVER01b]